MDVMEAIRQRRSVRVYEDRPVEDEKLQAVLEAGRLAPSGNNRQEWIFVVVRDAARREKLVEACCNQSFVATAPVVLVICTTDAKRTMRSGLRGGAVDTSIAVDHMTLAAVALGLGACWIGAFEADKVGRVVGLPEGVVAAHVLPLGYPGESPQARPRKPLEEVVRYDSFC
ncbi:MAG: nitroreductase [Anaerolineaceae bacterium]|nr:nitroreductase [Anaerolineaceae bacterium]